MIEDLKELSKELAGLPRFANVVWDPVVVQAWLILKTRSKL